MAKSLTKQGIDALKPKDKPYIIKDDSGVRGEGRLGIKVFPTGKKSFIYIYYIDGVKKTLTIGTYPNPSLGEARELARELGSKVKNGLDPKAEKEKLKEQKRIDEIEANRKAEAEARQGSVKQLFTAYTDNMKAEGKRTYEQVLSDLEKETYPIVPALTKANQVTSQHIKLILAKMIQRGAPTHSNRVRSYLHAAFSYGLKHDNDPANMSGEALFYLNSNPVTNVPKQKAAEKVRDEYFKKEEIKALFADLDDPAGGFSPVMRLLIKVLFYSCGQRVFEILNTQWSHVDLEKQVLEFPPDITKNKRWHVVPITETLKNLLLELNQFTGKSDYLFPVRGNADKPMPSTSAAQSLRRYCDNKAITRRQPRDIRTTVKTLMGEIGIDKGIRDKLQHHVTNDVSAKHYDKYDYLKEKRQAAERWEAWLNRLGETDSQVVSLRR